MNFEDFDRAFWLIGNWKKLPVSDVWAHFEYACVMPGATVSFRSPEIVRSKIKASKIEDILDGALVPSFGVSGEGFCFRYAQNASTYDRVIIESSSTCLSTEFCDELIEETMASDPNFVQAHLVNKKYQHLQNIFDPLQFKALGLSMDGLPMKSNGLPFPLEQQIVDTSKNPGRFVLRQEYVEVAAAAMWFGETFWNKVNTTAQKAIEDLPSDVTLEHESCWKLRSRTGIFVDQSTADIQNQIREALFGRMA